MNNYRHSFLAISHRKKLKCERFLDTMSKVIPWQKFIEVIEPYYKEKQRGRKKTDLLLLLKIYFLQQWYNLSDPGAEEAIYDRNSFQKFLGIDLLADTVPDETTILKFRHKLEENDLQEKLFVEASSYLEEEGLLLKEGTIADATIIAAPSSTKNKNKRRDEEMSSTKKGNNYHFGMKMHIGVDHKSGIVHSVVGSTAKEHDKNHLEDVLHGEEQVIGGDKGYYDEEQKRECRKEGIIYAVLDKGKRNHPLSNKQKKRNKKLSRVRGKVEFPFHIVKTLWGHVKTRYRGLKKNIKQWTTLLMLSNLYRVRSKLMAA